MSAIWGSTVETRWSARSLGPKLRAVAVTALIVGAIGGLFADAIHSQLHTYGGKVSGFVVFGSYFAKHTHPPTGAIVGTAGADYGYDGQFYYVLARDPLLRHAITLPDLGGQTFRAWRPAYPALAWSQNRRWLSCGLLVVCVLAREVMAFAVLAVFIDITTRAWQQRSQPGLVRRAVAELIPGVVIPGAVFVAWQAYVEYRAGGPVHGATTMFPFTTFVRAIHDALANPAVGFRIWDVGYEAIVIVGVIVALIYVWRRPTVLSIGAALFAFALTIGAFEPVWSDTRDSLPMLALLLASGLQSGRRLPVLVCVAAALTTFAIPVALPGLLTV